MGNTAMFRRYFSLIVSVALAVFCSNARSAPENGLQKEDGVLRLMSYNVHYNKGMDGKTDIGRLANIIRDMKADIVCMQEVDRNTARSGNVDMVKELAETFGKHGELGISYTLGNGKGVCGNAILSPAAPISCKKVMMLGRCLMIAEFDDYVIFCTHLSYNNAEHRLKNAATLNELADSFDKPVFLLGDLNDIPDSECLKELQKKWVVLTDTTKKTCPADNPTETIDYILGSRKHAGRYSLKKTGILNHPAASDHLPVFADIVFKTEG